MDAFLKNNIKPVEGELNEQTELVIDNIIKVFREICDENKRNELDYSAPGKLVAKCTGVSLKKIHQIHFKYNTSEYDLHRCRAKPKNHIDDIDKSVIREIVTSNYANGKFPSITKIIGVAKEKNQFFKCSDTSMRQIVKEIGFRYKIGANGKKRLVEKKSIACARLEFLRTLDELKKNGDTRPRIYIDEMWISRHYCKIITSETQLLRRGRKYIVCHAGAAKYGFIEDAEWIFREKKVNNDNNIHTKMTAKAFAEWFELLIQGLEEPSVIIMDDAYYHSKRINSGPTSSSSKEELEQWLKENNIAYSNTALKEELFKIVKENRPKKDYVVDHLANQSGHEIVRLPLYHKQYNPMALIFDKVKQDLDERTIGYYSVVDIEEFIYEAFGTVTKEDWIECVERAEAKQDEDYKKTISNDQVLTDDTN